MHNSERNRVSIIVAMDEARGIGKGNGLLFNIPEDMKRVKELTTGHPLVMGRKTFESLGRIIPNRTHIVVTRDPSSLKNLSYQPHETVSSVGEGIEVSKKYPGAEEVFIFGGGQIYAEALKQDLVDRLYLTIVEGNYEADTFFPEYSKFKTVIKEESHEHEAHKFKFVDLEK